LGHSLLLLQRYADVDVLSPAPGVAGFIRGADDEKVLYSVPIVPSASGGRPRPSSLNGEYADVDFTAATARGGAAQGGARPLAAAADEQVLYSAVNTAGAQPQAAAASERVVYSAVNTGGARPQAAAASEQVVYSAVNTAPVRQKKTRASINDSMEC
jgi:hypothetical protein